MTTTYPDGTPIDPRFRVSKANPKLWIFDSPQGPVPVGDIGAAQQVQLAQQAQPQFADVSNDELGQSLTKTLAAGADPSAILAEMQFRTQQDPSTQILADGPPPCPHLPPECADPRRGHVVRDRFLEGRMTQRGDIGNLPGDGPAS